MNPSEYGKSITITGAPTKEIKAKFFEIIEGLSQKIDGDSFHGLFPNIMFAAFGEFDVLETTQGKTSEGIRVYLNRDDFIIDGKDYSDLMPVILRHVIAQLWYVSKTGFSMSPPPEAIGKDGRGRFAYALALREEYRYAFELGKADRLLEFIAEHDKHVASSPQFVSLSNNNGC